MVLGLRHDKPPQYANGFNISLSLSLSLSLCARDGGRGINTPPTRPIIAERGLLVLLPVPAALRGVALARVFFVAGSFWPVGWACGRTLDNGLECAVDPTPLAYASSKSKCRRNGSRGSFPMDLSLRTRLDGIRFPRCSQCGHLGDDLVGRVVRRRSCLYVGWLNQHPGTTQNGSRRRTCVVKIGGGEM